MGEIFENLGINFDEAWRDEYKRIGNLYATWGAIMVIFFFPMAALPEVGIEKDNESLWYFFRFLPSVAVAIVFLLYKKLKFSHEVVFEVLALFIFASGAYRANCEDWMAYTMSNVTLFITAAILTILRPFLFVINFIVIISLNIGFHIYFCQATFIDFMLERSTPIFFVTGLAAFSIAIFRYYLMRDNFQQRLALKKAYTDLEETNNNLKEAHEELQAKTDQVAEQNEELLMQKEEILSQRDVLEKQKNLLEEKNEDIMSSISYAKRIQTALLPSHDKFRNNFSEYFIFFKPRDVVSGDFYWSYQNDSHLYLAAIDCTGHGVPGALMSMMSNAALNATIISKGVEDLTEVLSMLDHQISNELKGELTGTYDGFDISLCKFDKKSNRLEFASAHHPMILVQNNEVRIVRGGRSGIGGRRMKDKVFNCQSFNLNSGDVIFLYTDGYQDQFGGNHDKKYMSKRFQNLLINNRNTPFNTMEPLLEEELNQWMRPGKQKQIDDILVMGFRL